ncbi:DUF397 domain-containing protein [Nocardiopsis valliformis]|uniref:DUF397 domain-containing protein n=1 Tax=Nocardiopsis valliformis TaxID=239974 RepID=UPI000A0671C6|nr:DUF397 domain-containing protein [Nocardiopsis valliformis]
MSEARVWRKSSYSNGSGGHCVEVSEGAETWVRDTRNREMGYLSVPGAEWVSLIRTAALSRSRF